ncbi:MAG: ATP-binding cassette domain-containing protein, partial [Eubacterium sp.]|nr:ATP-binding cassette domain-containing protein [Eubacterium sp.]
VRNAENACEFSPEKGEVVFDHVYFRYPGGEEDALEDIDFTCEAGKTTAIIGSTGSGKSTIVNLLPRFYDVTKGSIKIDGVDIRDVTMESLRAGIGFVPQKGVLFTGTVAENIRFGKEDATQEEIERAAKLAMADGFVSDMENGYESIIAQGGSNVSGGQKQRLSIARALVKEAGIVVFDDSFSALDMKTDAELRRNLDEEHANVTKIIVAQRISTILNADRIIVVDDGKIVGNGTHAELMESCDVYGQIARSQLSERELEGIK